MTAVGNCVPPKRFWIRAMPELTTSVPAAPASAGMLVDATVSTMVMGIWHTGTLVWTIFPVALVSPWNTPGGGNGTYPEPFRKPCGWPGTFVRATVSSEIHGSASNFPREWTDEHYCDAPCLVNASHTSSGTPPRRAWKLAREPLSQRRF